MLDLWVQIGIALFGTAGVALLSCKTPSIRRWGYVAALCAEPCWLYSAFQAQQWGVTLMVGVYSVCWVRGIKNHFAIDRT